MGKMTDSRTRFYQGTNPIWAWGQLVLLLVAVLWFGSVPLYSQKDLVERVLTRLQQASETKQQFRVQAKLLSQKGNNESLNTELLLYVDRNGSTQKSLAKILAPERNKGQVFLNNTTAYWVYYPDLQRHLSLSPLATLAGDVSIGDILAPPSLELYDAKVLESDEQKVGLELRKKDRNAPYSRVVQHYEGEVLKTAEFYGGQKGDILMKRAQYTKPVELNHVYFYTQVKILNELQKGAYSVIAFSEPENASIPEAWFNPNNLQQIP